MNQQEHKKGLPFFGIGKILPFLKKFRRNLILMVTCGLMGSLVDIILPLFQALRAGSLCGQPDHGHHFPLRHCSTPSRWSSRESPITFPAPWPPLRRSASTGICGKPPSGHLQTLSFSYFNQNSVGYIHARVMSDTSRIGSLASWTLMDSVWHISYLVGSAAVMISLNARLAGLVLLILPVLVRAVLLFPEKAHSREPRKCAKSIPGLPATSTRALPAQRPSKPW